MSRDRSDMRKRIHALYRQEHEELGLDGVYRQLEEARRWKLAQTLRDGGVLVFPHAGVADCGHQIAAVVNACLDSGADKVLVVSVLHAFTEEMENTRVRVAAGEAPSKFRHWGIQGTGLDGRDDWRQDHALFSFRHFWTAESERRRIKAPQVVERYPYLAGGIPDELPGIDELMRQAEDSVLVSTADPFHHGIGYGTPSEEALPPDARGMAAARTSIEEGIELLAAADYWGYNQQCVRATSDPHDAGQVFRYVRGPMQGHILDLTYTDAAELCSSPPPTWVAAALVEWTPMSQKPTQA